MNAPRATRPGGAQAPQLPRRLRERAAGGVIRGVTRTVGLRPEMVPDHMRRQLRIVGISDEQIARVLPRMRSLADWPYVWEDEGDARAARDDWHAAFVSWYAAQRLLLGPSKLKRRLYRSALDAYARIDQPTLERFVVTGPHGQRIAGYLQLPARTPADARIPCVLMLPGITGTKEELHSYAMPLLRRGRAVARIDHPVYGETDGVLDEQTLLNPRHVLEHLARDPRLDPDALHIHGMSMGANIATHAAAGTRAASLTLICPPFQPSRYITQLPTSNLTALLHTTGLGSLAELVKFSPATDLDDVVRRLTMPVRLFHGGRDRTIPIDEAHAFAAGCSSPIAVTIYDRDHHGCLEHTDEIIAHTLEFMDDPHNACMRARTVERLDAAASLHVTDRDARIANAGLTPRRHLARLPFLLPGVQARRARSAD